MRFGLFFLMLGAFFLVIGCSGGGGSPFAPQTPGEDNLSGGESYDLAAASMPDGGHVLWGYWQGTFDLASRSVDVVRLRQAEFHANLAGVLRNTPLGLTYKVKSFDMIKGTASVDVTLTHPYPNSDFRGFDTRGIFMGPGATLKSTNDPSIIYPAPNGCRVLNADGYTRWWNAPEFTTAGTFGYDDNSIIPGFLIPTTTLNPYKYFADCLGADDAVVPNVDMSNRGTFSTDLNPSKLTRNYEIQFPKVGGQSKFVFHYAVDVNWAPPTGNSPTPKPIDDFPMNANCREAYHINVDTTGTTAWYKNDAERGGEIKLAVEVFDWQAATNPEGILGEIESIWVESKTLFDSYYAWPVTPDPGSDVTSGIFNFTIPNVTPTGKDNQEILITVRSKEPDTYKPPVNGPKYPLGARLSAYAVVNIPINDSETHTIHVIKPNGNELLMATASSTIEWETSPYAGIENVAILISKNSGVDYNAAITYSAPNTGSYIFYNIPETYIGSHNRIKIVDTANTALYDESDSDFTILPKMEDQILVAKPNGGEEWIAGTSENIEWVGDPNIPNVAIKLSGDSGETWPLTIKDSTPMVDGEYSWGPIPQENVGSKCRIGVFAANNPNIYDASDADFTIAEPGIEVVTPIVNEIWEIGNPVDVTWKASDVISNLDILLSLDGGATYPIAVATNTPNDGSFAWGVDDAALAQTIEARIRVQDHANPALYFDDSPDFTILEKTMTLTYPNGGEVWRIGYPQTIEWLWTGNIPLVDIKMSLDGGMTFDNYIVQDEPNTGSFDIAFLDAAWLTDHTKWDFTSKEAKIRIEASGNPSLHSESANIFTIPITLGILNGKNSAASGDLDDDGVKNGVETLLAMNQDDFDSDHDGMYDFNELFTEISYGAYDLIPDSDGDGEYAPKDTDDNADGIHDGELVDSDKDGVANYLEYYGFTYNWLTGKYLKYDEGDVENDFTVPYFRTDPMQPSSDQDPYGDGMEVSGLLMDQSVQEPGDSPMVPACPDIVVRLAGYEVTLNSEIQNSKGESASKQDNWNRQTEQTSSFNTEHKWEVKAGYKVSIGTKTSHEISVEGTLGGTYTTENSTATTVGTGTSLSETWQWSTTSTSNTTQTAKIKLFLKVQNKGAASASNIIPTLTLTIGNKPVTTFTPSNTQINILPPGGVYPSGAGNFWVVDSKGAGEPIYLSLDELKLLETGAPITISIPQMKASVAALNDKGYWEYVGDWGEFMARVNAVSATLYIDGGDGNPINYKVYADDDPSSPKVTLGDAFIWAAGAEEMGSSVYVNYKLADGSLTKVDINNFQFSFDPVTWATIQDNLTGGDTFSLMDIPLKPGAVIVGKAPPQPPLDKPQIHWACYVEEEDTVYAGVTDYFAVDEVWLDSPLIPGTKDFPMTYDTNLGCYTAELSGAYTYTDGADTIGATNISGMDAVPYSIDKNAEAPIPPADPVPTIENSKITIGETLTHLTFSVQADVTPAYSGDYVISTVYLVNSLGEHICQLSGPASGGLFTSSSNPATYMPDGNEKILAVNDAGYQTIQKVESYVTPPQAYNYGWWLVASAAGTYYWDAEYDTFGTTRNADSDLKYIKTPQNTVTYYLMEPTNVEWARLPDYQYPTRSFIKSLSETGKLAQTPTYFQVWAPPRDQPYKLINGDSVAFITEQGRYAYFSIIDAGGGSYARYFCVYSIFDGLGG